MEYLHGYLPTLKQKVDFNFHLRCQKLDVIHLCFVDDLLLFTKGDEQSILLLTDKFISFPQASGLRPNLNKSQVYLGGVKPHIQSNILDILGYEASELPFRYLGGPLSSKRLTMMQCKPVESKITERITTWIPKIMPYASKLYLIKVVLFGVQAY